MSDSNGHVTFIDMLQRGVQCADALITPERLRNYPAIFVVLSGLLLSISTVQRIQAPASFGPITPDYLAHWTGGVLFLQGQSHNLYDLEAQRLVQADVVGPSSSLSWFVSPPLVAVLYSPFALLDYTWSALLWSLISLALLGACLWALRDVAPGMMSKRRGLVVLVVCASAAFVELVGGGQDSAFVLAVWVLALRLIKSPHQVLAGAVLGLALLKPQHVVLVPLVLLASRRVAALIGFLITAIAQGVLTLVVAGTAGTLRWVETLLGGEFGEQVQAGQAWKMVSLPAFIHAVIPDGVPPAWKTLVVLTVILGAAVLLVVPVARTSFRIVGGADTRRTIVERRDPVALLIAALATSVVFSPHLVVYDAILLVPVALFLLERLPMASLRLGLVTAFWSMWLAPALHLLAEGPAARLPFLDVPWSALPLVVVWTASLRVLHVQQRSSSG